MTCIARINSLLYSLRLHRGGVLQHLSNYPKSITVDGNFQRKNFDDYLFSNFMQITFQSIEALSPIAKYYL